MRRIASAAIGALVCLSAPARADILVTISKSQQRAAVTVDGAETYRWPVSTGRRGHATPAGHFRPARMERHWYSRQYQLTPMPWAVFFHRGYAVHGTMEAYNLGHAASHGCVRLRPDNAAILYSLVRREGLANTKVVVLNGPLPAPAGARPMAEDTTQPLSTEEKSVMASAEEATDHLSAKTHADVGVRHEPENVRREEPKPEPKQGARTRLVSVDYRVSAGSDEGRILREREAWLRSLDRKYHFTR